VSRRELMMRVGYYSGAYARFTGDHAYASLFIDRAHLQTDEQLLARLAELNTKLVSGGYLAPDEDPFAQEITFRSEN
jgi:hypothetical protein